MLKYMLDTDISIYIIKNKPTYLRDILNKNYSSVAISIITLMELLYGAEKSSSIEKNLKEVEGYAARLKVLEYDIGAASQTAQIRAELVREGTPIGPYDSMIAGHARSMGLILVSNNTKEFQRVSGLRLENWLI